MGTGEAVTHKALNDFTRAQGGMSLREHLTSVLDSMSEVISYRFQNALLTVDFWQGETVSYPCGDLDGVRPAESFDNEATKRWILTP